MTTRQEATSPSRPATIEQRPTSGPDLRGDDALSRAAADIAAPRRRLLAGLRDAHAEACARLAALRRCDAALASGASRHAPVRPVLARLVAEAEEQLRRLELVFAQLRERPGAGLVGTPANDLVAMAGKDGPGRDAALLLALEGEERRGREEALALRRLAAMAGQHLAARLLDLTASEREAAARDIAASMLPPDQARGSFVSH
jgi:hypothetical protein